VVAAQATGKEPESRPQEVPAVEQEAAQNSAAHEVRRGDTLWDLAGRYLQNPFRWQELFQLNTSVVEDPHWIYPGEMLALPDGSRVALGPPGTPTESWQPSTLGAGTGVSGFGGTSLFDTSPDAGNVLGGMDIDVYSEPELLTQSDFYRAPFLAEPEDFAHVGVTGRKIEGNPLHLSIPSAVRLNDVVVIALNGISVAPGEWLQAIRWQSAQNGEAMVRSMARLEVTDIEADSARAKVIQLFAEYEVGDPVVLAEPYLVNPGLSHTAVEGGMATKVLGFEVSQAILGENDMIFLGVGEADGVRLGDEFALFDLAETADARWEDRLATARVVRVRPESATARVIDLRDTSPEVGAPARLVRRAIGG
jgi:hypothetical protein